MREFGRGKRMSMDRPRWNCLNPVRAPSEAKEGTGEPGYAESSTRTRLVVVRMNTPTGFLARHACAWLAPQIDARSFGARKRSPSIWWRQSAESESVGH